MDIPSRDTDFERLSMGAFCRDVEQLSMGAFCVDYHRVGDGPEGSGVDFRPDRPTDGRMAAKNLVTPNLNFPAKNVATIRWGMAQRGQVPIFGRIDRPVA